MSQEANSSGTKKEPVEDLLGRLNLLEDEQDDFIWEEEIEEPPEVAKWLAIAKVHTSKGFSPSALYAEMRSAWNPAKEVKWRKIENNLFTIQFGCLADWNKATKQGPWLFRNQQALLIQEYDGFLNPRSVILDKLDVWGRVLKLPDNYLKKEEIIKGMCRTMGQVLEVQTLLPAGYAGEFVKIKVRIDVNKKLSRFVSITKNQKKEFYQVQYEKLPIFCANCGLIGHWYQECGTGEHDVTKLEWGDFILVDAGRGRGRGHGAGRGTAGGPAMGRGRARGGFNQGGFAPGHNGNILENPIYNPIFDDDDDGGSRDALSRKSLNFDPSVGVSDPSSEQGVSNAITLVEKNTETIATVNPPRVDSTPEKVQIQKKAKRGEEESNKMISATPVSGVDRTQ